MINSKKGYFTMKKDAFALFLALSMFSASPVFAFDTIDADDVLIYDDNTSTLSALEVDEVLLFSANEADYEIVTISTADELISFRDTVNSNLNYSSNKIFKLTNDIDLGGIEWVPIGYNSTYKIGDDLNVLGECAFKGIFDGQGHTVSNFKMTDTSCKCMGFFGTVFLGEVRNFNISDAYIDFNGKNSSQLPEFTGLLSAFSNYAVISNCTVSGDITVTNTSVFDNSAILYTGAVSGIGLAQIDNCSYSGNISVNTLIPAYVGGILGYASESASDYDFTGRISDCTVNANINVCSVSGVSSGGIIGRDSFDFSDISNCSYSDKSSITVTHTYSTENPTSAPIYVGGIAGINRSELSSCYVGECMLKAECESSATVGGIVGKNEYEIDRCVSDADITVDLNRSSIHTASTPAVGGIAGINGSNCNTTSDLSPAGITPVVSNSAVDDNISININSDSSSSTVCGFIVGLCYAPSEIINCACAASDLNISSTNAGVYVGGICGYLNGGAVKYCHTSGTFGENISCATSAYIGGIVGDANLKYFYTYDTSFGVENPQFVKTCFYGGYIENCSSDMDISISDANVICAGGICGYLTNNYTYNGTAYYITATRELGISKCCANGTITVTPSSNTFVGGLVGYSVDGKIYNSYSDATVTVTSDASNTYAGGFVGTVYQNKHDYQEPVAILQNCYSSSIISVPNSYSKLKVGDFSGYIVRSPVTLIYPQFIDCYYVENIAQSGIDGLISISDLSDISALKNWDFENVWYMTDTRPILKHEKSGIYEYSAEDTNITSIIISRPQNNSRLYAAYYDGEQLSDVSSYEISGGNFVNDYFLFLPCDITVTDNFAIYLWSDGNEPLMNK